MRGKKSPDELDMIRERVAKVIASRDDPPGLGELYHLCADFASDYCVRRAVATLVADGRVTSRLVRRLFRYHNGALHAECRVYRHVPYVAIASSLPRSERP